MKIKLAMAAALLVCQVLSAAALAQGQPGVQPPSIGEDKGYLVAQADINTGSTSAGSGMGGEPSAAPPGKAKRKHTGRAGKHKRGFHGRPKHRLSSGLRCPPQDQAGTEGNTCCATAASGM